MSLPQFFLDEQVLAQESSQVFPLLLSPEDVRHALVLRLRKGEHIAIVDAQKNYFECEIVSFDQKELAVRIARRGGDQEKLPHVILVQGLAKADKMEAIIRHATEIGIERFIPLLCIRSVVRLDEKRTESRLRRWRHIARSAAMQSGRRTVPEISAPIAVADACECLKKLDAAMVCWEQAPSCCGFRKAMTDILSSSKLSYADLKVAVVVGPEGGLKKEEVDLLAAGNPLSRVVSLGSGILRTETAAIVASALAMYELGALGNDRPVL